MLLLSGDQRGIADDELAHARELARIGAVGVGEPDVARSGAIADEGQRPAVGRDPRVVVDGRRLRARNGDADRAVRDGVDGQSE